MEYGQFLHQGTTMDVAWKRSAIRYVAQVHTPTMLMHGENDPDVPIEEAEQYYVALKDVGVETIFVRYPREGHGLAETGHVIDNINRKFRWYEAALPEAGRRRRHQRPALAARDHGLRSPQPAAHTQPSDSSTPNRPPAPSTVYPNRQIHSNAHPAPPPHTIGIRARDAPSRHPIDSLYSPVDACEGVTRPPLARRSGIG